MNPSVKAAQIFIPSFLKKRRLNELFLLTANAFGMDAPLLDHMSFKEQLAIYARFTRDATDNYLNQRKDIESVRRNLFQNAFSYGSRIKRSYRINNRKDALVFLRILYHQIGIDISVDMAGQLCVDKCYFSHHYSGRVCRVISALDSGIVAGLLNAGPLRFEQRITEGFDTCRARIIFEESGN